MARITISPWLLRLLPILNLTLSYVWEILLTAPDPLIDAYSFFKTTMHIA